MEIKFYEKFHELTELMEKLGNDYAEKRAQSWQLQEMQSVVLAEIQNNLFKAMPGLAIGKAEIMAKADPAYAKHILGTAQAIREENIAKARFEKVKAEFEAYRSLSSLEKAKMNLT